MLWDNNGHFVYCPLSELTSSFGVSIELVREGLEPLSVYLIR